MILAERRAAGENPNWTEILGNVAAVINSQHGRGANDTSAYYAVTGQKYHHDFTCSKEEARRCWTLDERMKVTNDIDFEKYVKENYILDDDDDDASEDDDDDDEQVDYWSDDDLPFDESDEVGDDMFDMQISFDINDMNLTVPEMPGHHYDLMIKSPPTIPSLPSWSGGSYLLPSVASTDLILIDEDMKLPATRSSTGYASDRAGGPLVKPSVASTDLIDEDMKLPATNDTSVYTLDTPQLDNRVSLCSMSDGWKGLESTPRRGCTSAKELLCRLNCEVCNGFCGRCGLSIPKKEYLDHLTVSEDWFSSGFIAGFVLLATHDAHLSSILHPMDHKIMPVFTPYPNAHVSKILPYGDNTHFVSVVYNRSHFAVLYYDIAGRTVIVYDGLNYDVDTWGPHVVHTIQTYGLASVQEYTKVIDKNEHTDDFGRKIKETKLTLRYEGYQGLPSTVWTVTNHTTYEQNDSHNCGPIACMKLLEIHGLIAAGSIDQIGLGQSMDTYRSVVIKYFQDSVLKYNEVLNVERRNRSAIASKAVDQRSDAMLSHPIDLISNANSTSPSANNGISTLSTNRTRAMAMKNSKQQQSAIKEMKRCAKNAIDLGATVGAVVTLQVDYRTNPMLKD